MTNKKQHECSTCGYRWKHGENGSHSCVERLRHQLDTTEKLLEERQRVLDAIPPCPVHGPCIPHALEWLEEASKLMDGVDSTHITTSEIPDQLSVGIGSANQDYRIGDFMNAVNELFCFFDGNTNHGAEELASALRLYADQL